MAVKLFKPNTIGGKRIDHVDDSLVDALKPLTEISRSHTAHYASLNHTDSGVFDGNDCVARDVQSGVDAEYANFVLVGQVFFRVQS